MGFLPRVLSAIGVRNLLQSLSGTNRLDASAIKNLPIGVGGGDMFKSVYDTNDNGVVDNAAALNGQTASYYLDRTNHAGTQSSTTIGDFAEAVDDRVAALLVAGSGIGISYNDTSNALTISNTDGSGSGLSAWQLKTANYTAVAGDRLRVDATAGDVVITLPATPSISDADVWLQRVDTTTNKALLRTGINNIKSQSNQDGVFAPGANLDRIERVSYINSSIGWLGQHGQLTYQAAPSGSTDPNFASVGLLLQLDSGFTDSSSNNLTVAQTSTTISTSTQKWGAGSAQFNGSTSLLTLPSATVLNRGTGDWTWEMFVNIDSGASTGQRNLLNAPGSSANGLGIDANRRLIWWVDGIGNQITGTPAQLLEGVWNYIAVIKASNQITVRLNNSLYVAAFTNTASYNFSSWMLGSNQFNSKFKGFMDSVRFTTIARTITAEPSAPFPNS